MILGLDTSLAACSAALVEGDRVRAAASEAMARGHQERLAPMVRELMASVGARFADLDRIAVTVGPGSFTGLRVGLAFAKGMGLALGKPVAGVGTLAALAATEAGEAMRLAVIDAGRGRMWLQVFAGGQPLGPPRNLALEEALAWAAELESRGGLEITGPGLLQLARVTPAARRVDCAHPAPEAVARLGAAEDAPRAHPVYLRAPDACPKLGGGVRAAGLADAALLARLHAACFEHPWDEAALIRLMTTSAAFALVGRDEGGFILCRLAADEAEVLTIAVTPKARRAGLGRSLLRSALAKAAALGAASIVLEVREGNEPALRLYQAEAFTPVGRRTAYYGRGDSTMNAVILRRALNSGGAGVYAPAASE